MSTHLEFQLDDDTLIIEQDFTLFETHRIIHVAPKLHIFNDPAGTFLIELKEGSTVLGSKSHTSASINTLLTAQFGIAQPYKIGYFLFTLDEPVNLRLERTYTIKLSTIGYTFSATSSIGWIKEYVDEANKQESDPVLPINDLGKAFSYRLWESDAKDS